MSSLDRGTRGALLAPALVLLPVLFGCLLVPNNEPDPQPVEGESCSDDHDDFWEPDPQGATIQISGAAADSSCNEAQWFQGGGAQGGGVFHFEPQLRVTSTTLQPPQFPALEWELLDPETDELVQGSIVEVYDEDISRDAAGFTVRPRAFITAEERGKNFVVRMSMELVDTTIEVTDSSQTNVVRVSAQAGVHLVE